jgi:hypothetical protein
MLQGGAWLAPQGELVGAYIIHFADGASTRIPLAYGEDMKTWLLDKDVARPISNGVIAWRGRQIRPSEGKDRYITLYRWTWENPRPDTEVERIDFESSMGKCAPFLLGITVEP